MPRTEPTKAKVAAYRSHWRVVGGIADELSSRLIHNKTSIGEVASDAQLGYGTVKRFFSRGRGAGRMTYSFFHGPSITTVVGIAGAIGLELKLQPKRRNGKG